MGGEFAGIFSRARVEPECVNIWLAGRKDIRRAVA
jgi:hypothetical protein